MSRRSSRRSRRSSSSRTCRARCNSIARRSTSRCATTSPSATVPFAIVGRDAVQIFLKGSAPSQPDRCDRPGRPGHAFVCVTDPDALAGELASRHVDFHKTIRESRRRPARPRAADLDGYAFFRPAALIGGSAASAPRFCRLPSLWALVRVQPGAPNPRRAGLRGADEPEPWVGAQQIPGWADGEVHHARVADRDGLIQVRERLLQAACGPVQHRQMKSGRG